MEVKEAIEFIERYRYAKNSKTDDIIDLLKSLEAENKKLKKENKALRKDKWELEGINEACRKENEAYREMWEEVKRKSIYERLELEEDKEMMFLGAYILKWKNGNYPEPECGFTECNFEKLEQTYLGGGE